MPTQITGLALKNKQRPKQKELYASSLSQNRGPSAAIKKMTNYYELLNIPKHAGKKRAYTAFKKRFLRETSKEVKVELLTGFLVIVNERQKFLDILLAQSAKGRKLTPKYLAVIDSERKKAAAVLADESREAEVRRILKTYPLKESLGGLAHVILPGADQHYLKITYIALFIGIVLMFQTADGLPLPSIGISLILTGIIAHFRFIRSVKISKLIRLSHRRNH